MSESKIPPVPPLTRGKPSASTPLSTGVRLGFRAACCSPVERPSAVAEGAACKADATKSRGGISRSITTTIAILATTLLTACTGLGPRLILDRPADVSEAGTAPRPATPANTSPRGGGYYKDDGPGDNPPDLAAIPDADPRIEPLHRFANNPYNVFGVPYAPLRSIAPFRESGLASWYGRKFHGQKTSSGETYDMYGMTAAHPTLPIPSYARVTNPANGRSVIVRVNDRGPFHNGRIMDLSYTAAWKLGYVNVGSTAVEVELLTPELIAALPTRTGRGTATTVAAAAPRAQGAPVAERNAPQTVAQVTAIKAVEAPQASALPGTPAPVAQVQTAALPVEVQSGGVFLQLGAFSGRDNAESFRARVYRELGWLTDGIEIYQQGGLFRLHLGPYRDRGEAGGIAERIRTALELKPMIVVR